jgi:hypothetical protein
MSLQENALTTVEEVLAHLDLSIETVTELEYAKIEAFVNATSEKIETYCNRSFRLQEHVDILDGKNITYLLLKEYPVEEISEVIEDELTLEADDYELVAKSGMLFKSTGWVAGERTVRVTYTAGYVMPGDDGETTLPGALGIACILFVKALYNELDAKMSEKFSDYSVSYARQFTDAFSKAIPLPPVVQMMVSAYKGRS